MKLLRNVDSVKTIDKKKQKMIRAGHCPPCPPGQCGQIIFPGPDWFCTPC